jgi:hypothetical protein
MVNMYYSAVTVTRMSVRLVCNVEVACLEMDLLMPFSRTYARDLQLGNISYR